MTRIRKPLTATLAAAATLAASALVGAHLSRAADATYPAAHFALEIDGASAPGFVEDVRGGALQADVSSAESGEKWVSGVSFAPLIVEVDPAALPPGLAGWIDEALAGADPRRDVSIAEFGAFGFSKGRGRTLLDAHITELKFPRLDGAATDAGRIQVEITPEAIEYTSWPLPRPETRPPDATFLVTNFRAEIGGVQMHKSSKGDSPTLEFTNAEPMHLLPNLRLTIPAEDADPWRKWFQSFVLEGRNSDVDERNGSIVFLDEGFEEELGHIDLKGVGIFKLDDSDSSADGSAPARVQVELYVEQMGFDFPER